MSDECLLDNASGITEPDYAHHSSPRWPEM